MTESQTFSASGEEAISRAVNAPILMQETPVPESSEFALYYELERTAQIINESDFKRIALQFPDELLHDSVPVYHRLKFLLPPSREIYILADTSYGSCCVDEVAASHVNADLIVHYGHACMSKTSRVPVVYVFGRSNLDISLCASKVLDYITSHSKDLDEVNSIVLRHDVTYTHLSNQLVSKIREVLGNCYEIIYNAPPIRTFPHRSSDDILASEPGHSERVISRQLLLWVGDESPTLTKILMTTPSRDIISFSPSLGLVHAQSHQTNKMLMRRYAFIQKARDADVFGILAGTLGVASYLPMISHLRTCLKKAQKKSYTISVGKINPAKLANFMEIECWIWVACSEGMVDSKDYLRPIITPYELELALQEEPNWPGNYILDFDELLANASLIEQSDQKQENDEDPDRPMFSMVTGKYRQAKRYDEGPKESPQPGNGNSDISGDLSQQNQENKLMKMGISAAAQFLQTRTYQGLDPRHGQDEPSLLEQGRSGIARGYSDDHRGPDST